jgi:hypothetical protein
MPLHTFAPPAFSREPSAHVSEPGSPGFGIVSNCHTISPVRALNARMEPGYASSLSLVEKPMMSVSSKTTPGTVTPMKPRVISSGVMSTFPPSPKPLMSWPSVALIPISVFPCEKNSRLSSRFAQYIKPRCAPPSIPRSLRHISSPVAAFKAKGNRRLGDRP